MPQFSATFVPGSYDDYYMPEVVAPAPQRVTPQVPQNMQEDLQRMELEAREVDPRRDSAAISPGNQTGRHEREPSLSTVLTKDSAKPEPPPKNDPDTRSDSFKPFQDTAAKSTNTMRSSEAPSFSPFPKVKGDNIPPSDDEKEEILSQARQHVLHSNNVSMQLSWARDTLAWVEIVLEASVRELAGKPRPQTPKMEHDLRVDAVNIVQYLATQDHPEALFMQAKWLEFGKFGYRPDKKSAYTGYQRAAEMGYGRAEYRMGMLYENSNDFSKANEHYYKGLALKDSAASYRLGMMHLLGQHGQPKDFQRGVELINQAADGADEDAPQGAYVFGMLIARDLPDIYVPDALLPPNMSLARMYIEKAAYLGFAKAQLKMGQAYELCQLGLDFNPAYSLHYYGLAAKQGQPEAALGVSRWFLFGYEGFFNKNEQLAFKYAEEAATAKLPTGEFAMGYYHEIGIHVQKDLRQAKTWYELAAEHGNKDAVGRLESLNQSKTLTKADHETTTLTRIKSQHGSQRGKRPDRFKQTSSMPTVTESGPSSPVDGRGDLPSMASKVATPSPKVSPQPSPRSKPTMGRSSGEYSGLPSQQGDRPPAFALNLEGNMAIRPKSTAPYPDDDRPPPLNLNRPTSTAPYPEDDGAGRPHYPTANQLSMGPQADRPMSAFGIRPLNAGPPGPQQGAGGPIRASQSMANLVPPAGADPRGRVVSAGWDPQVPAAYRQPSPGPAGHNYPRNDFRQEPARPSTVQPYPVAGGPVSNNPAHNRLTKQNPNPNKPQPPQPPGAFPMGGGGGGGYGPQDYGQPAQPGRDYGPRISSRPVSGEPQRPVSEYDRYSRIPPGNAARPDRVDSLPPGHSRLPSGQGPRPGPFKDRPDLMEHAPNRVGSAPPSSQPRPQQKPSPAQSNASLPAPNKVQQKPASQGPATFEEMGIPQGKNEGDCVVM